MKKYSASCLIMASMLVLSSCSSKNDTQLEEQASAKKSGEELYELSKTQFESSQMKLGALELKTFHQVVKANGMFDVPPTNKASVSSYYGGTVQDIQLLPGERVKKGQRLFTLENPDFVQMQQEFLEAKGQLVYLKTDYERQKNLAKDNVASQKNFLKAEADYTVTRVRVESLSKKLTLMNINPNTLTIENIRTTVNINSPMNGYITQINITTGAFLNPAESAITMVNTDHMHLELNIFEKDLPKVKIGQPITFTIQQEPDVEYKAVVHLVNKTVDPKNRTIAIHGHLLDEKQSSFFTPGMYVEAEIYSTTNTKAALPKDALVEMEGKFYVLMLKTNTNDRYSLAKKEVTVGESNNGFIEILNYQDFNDSTQFLINGSFNLITD